MSDLVRFLLLSVLCSSLALAQDSSSDGNQETSTVSQEAARGLASSYEPEDKQALRKNSHIFMGIYKNYKSTYLGNKTTSEYKKRLRDRVSAPQMAENETPEMVEPDQEDQRDSLAQEIRQDAQAEALMETQTESPNYDDSESLAAKKRRKRKRKDRNKRKDEVESETDQPDPAPEDETIQRYNVGPGLNVSLDMSNDIVHVKLDGENLKEIIGARWLTLDNSEEGEFYCYLHI